MTTPRPGAPVDDGMMFLEDATAAAPVLVGRAVDVFWCGGACTVVISRVDAPLVGITWRSAQQLVVHDALEMIASPL